MWKQLQQLSAKPIGCNSFTSLDYVFKHVNEIATGTSEKFASYEQIQTTLDSTSFNFFFLSKQYHLISYLKLLNALFTKYSIRYWPKFYMYCELILSYFFNHAAGIPLLLEESYTKQLLDNLVTSYQTVMSTINISDEISIDKHPQSLTVCYYIYSYIGELAKSTSEPVYEAITVLLKHKRGAVTLPQALSHNILLKQLLQRALRFDEDVDRCFHILKLLSLCIRNSAVLVVNSYTEISNFVMSIKQQLNEQTHPQLMNLVSDIESSIQCMEVLNVEGLPKYANKVLNEELKSSSKQFAMHMQIVSVFSNIYNPSKNEEIEKLYKFIMEQNYVPNIQNLCRIIKAYCDMLIEAIVCYSIFILLTSLRC